ncbi:hypothetical protein V1227_22575 [Lentzea sp. DG1S-22]|uniref:hypothetical protein n=1 Tax=Lentzea sp. DG1S-22 TaxID=3108822 RepID=UPI002E793C18|nr:hypothetical protein [Lentzea sp. DG1S-22]WVH77885.1 hypothetical protein V1227_22575 [Lentzea sp. DG1S-22]
MPQHFLGLAPLVVGQRRKTNSVIVSAARSPPAWCSGSSSRPASSASVLDRVPGR